MTDADGSRVRTDGDNQADRTDRPSRCENPEADCYRKPSKFVRWAEDFTSETPNVEVWLCGPCASILRRGTAVSPNELTIRSVDTATPREDHNE